MNKLLGALLVGMFLLLLAQLGALFISKAEAETEYTPEQIAYAAGAIAMAKHVGSECYQNKEVFFNLEGHVVYIECDVIDIVPLGE